MYRRAPGQASYHGPSRSDCWQFAGASGSGQGGCIAAAAAHAHLQHAITATCSHIGSHTPHLRPCPIAVDACGSMLQSVWTQLCKARLSLGSPLRLKLLDTIGGLTSSQHTARNASAALSIRQEGAASRSRGAVLSKAM